MKISQLFFLLLPLFFSVNAFGQQDREVEVDATPPTGNRTETTSTKPVKAPKKAWRGKQNGRYGFYDAKVIYVPFEYDELPEQYSDFMLAKKRGKFGVIDRLNNIIVPFELDKISRIYQDYSTKKMTDYYFVQKGKQYGIFDRQGQFVIPPIYPYLDRLAYNLYGAGRADGAFGILGIDGKEIHPFTFEARISTGLDGAFVTKKEGKAGVIDARGKTVLPFTYDHITLDRGTERQLYIIRQGEKTGAMDKRGKVLVPVEYKYVSSIMFKGYLAITTVEDKMGLMDYSGKIALAPNYDRVEQKRGRFFIVSNAYSSGVLNSAFQPIIPIEYSRIDMKGMKYFEVTKGGGRGIIDTLGNQVLPCNFRITRICNNLIFASAMGQPRALAAYNEQGEQLTAPLYYEARPAYHYSIVNKSQGGKYALFDNATATELTPFVYDRIRVSRSSKDQDELVIKAEREGRKVRLDAKGQEIGQPGGLTNSAKIKLRGEKIRAALPGSWIGIITLNNQSFLQQFVFTDKDFGIRKIYYLEKGKECYIQQTFQMTSSSYEELIVKPGNYPELVEGNGPMPGVFQNNSQDLMRPGFFKVLGIMKEGNIVLKGLSKIKPFPVFKKDYDGLRQLRQIALAEATFTRNTTPKPGGIQSPAYRIDPQSLDVFIYSYGKVYLIGKLAIDEAGYALQTQYWEQENHYSLSAVLKDIPYLDAKGQRKRGDLDLCFKASNTHHFWLRETR